MKIDADELLQWQQAAAIKDSSIKLPAKQKHFKVLRKKGNFKELTNLKANNKNDYHERCK
jgi:hypothetical protein